MNDSNGQDDYRGIVEEYRALRAELMWHQESRERNTLYFLIVASGLMGYGLAHRSPFIFVLVYILATYFWTMDITHKSAIPKIGSYIALHLESRLPNMEWERCVFEVDRESSSDLIPFQGRLGSILERYMNPFSVFMLSSIVLFFVYSKKSWLSSVTWTYVIAITLIVILLQLVVISRIPIISYFYPYLRDKWREKFQKLLSRAKE